MLGGKTAWAMWTKDCLDFKYPTISLAFLDTFSAMEKVSETDPDFLLGIPLGNLFHNGYFALLSKTNRCLLSFL